MTILLAILDAVSYKIKPDLLYLGTVILDFTIIVFAPYLYTVPH